MTALLRGLRPPRKLRVTFPGKWFLALTVGVGVAAINTGNNLLYLALSMNLSLIILSGILSEWCIRRLHVRVSHASEAFASRDSLLAVTCKVERRRFPAISVSVSTGLPGAGRNAWFSEIAPGTAETRVIPYRPARRGPVPSFTCTVSTRFPFALFEKSKEVSMRESPLIVYPEPGGPRARSAAADSGEPASGQTVSGSEGASIRGVRDHLPTDPVRNIHWKKSARLAKWMVKEKEAETAQASEISLPVPSPPREFERMVSRACALVLRCEREGTPYRLLVGDRVLVGPADGGRRRKALSILARVEADGTLPSAPNGMRA